MALACTVFFFFNDTATTEIYTLSLHDALPICADLGGMGPGHVLPETPHGRGPAARWRHLHLLGQRSEEHTSELQSPCNLVCRLLLEKKKKPPALRRDAHAHRYSRDPVPPTRHT